MNSKDDTISQTRLQHLVDGLLAVEDYEFIEILRNLFSKRMPFPDDGASSESHYFLGISSRHRLDDGDDNNLQQWTQWQIAAIAYVNRETVGSDVIVEGPGFCQSGSCLNCSTKLSSNSKDAICPICGHNAHLS